VKSLEPGATQVTNLQFQNMCDACDFYGGEDVDGHFGCIQLQVHMASHPRRPPLTDVFLLILKQSFF
jgi:hypothetical protein